MFKKLSFTVLILSMLIVMTSCGSKSNKKEVADESSNSTSKKFIKFSIKSKPKKIKEIKNHFALDGYNTQVTEFNDGYQVDITDTSVVAHFVSNLKTNDEDQYIRNTLQPVVTKISKQSESKIYMRSGGSNNNLLFIINKGSLKWSLFDKSIQIQNSLKNDGVSSSVKQSGNDTYKIKIKSSLKSINKSEQLKQAVKNAHSIDGQVRFNIYNGKNDLIDTNV
ncbi:hypothetical protein [Pediococcus argentinicus]|uniref:Lipoprotein n=1 Tax=Pediococcus argentinicus TaxID=480391 RepID=A0A0R2NGF1_9LACO|nr:hypothetical protein [Pediococcus argentinicus]KRO24903.1 hypothetical protein IV88_GL000567 [Pediococcus argentinicus]NKZ22602.1 hypothetical protein [Pediococcus argentinicus]GEP19739.1 hypothetical protein LSA03_11230 [Pediococcus argentinicus]